MEILGLCCARVLRTNSSLSNKAGVDVKTSADQRDHRLGVSLEVYTNSNFEQKQAAVYKLETALVE